MNSLTRFLRTNYREIFYQLTIVVVLFIFFSHNQEGTEQVSLSALFAPSKLAFFANYMMGAMVINYMLLPILYYKKKPFLSVVSVILVLVLIVLIDEFFLEQIYFPDTRGAYFPGISYTVIETLPIILIFTVFKFAWDFQRKEREIDKLKSLAQESEIKFLKSQVNPHFLFNNLNNLYAKVLKNSPTTPNIILELSSVLR
ncbi:MAG: histidine kinase, partial [Bacteroidota bacterium]